MNDVLFLWNIQGNFNLKTNNKFLSAYWKLKCNWNKYYSFVWKIICRATIVFLITYLPFVRYAHICFYAVIFLYLFIFVPIVKYIIYLLYSNYENYRIVLGDSFNRLFEAQTSNPLKVDNEFLKIKKKEVPKVHRIKNVISGNRSCKTPISQLRYHLEYFRDFHELEKIITIIPWMIEKLFYLPKTL